MPKRKPKNLTTDPEVFWVETAEQFEAIVSPVRDQIFQVVINQTQANPDGSRTGVSIHEIGRQIGRKAGSLYRHIDRLLEVGLIEAAGEGTTGGREAGLFAAPGKIVLLRTPRAGDPALDALCRYIERSARTAGIESAKAARLRVADPEEEKRDQIGRLSPQSMLTVFGWLTPEQRSEVTEHMHAIARVFEDASLRPGTELAATSVYIRPVIAPDGSVSREPPVAD